MSFLGALSLLTVLPLPSRWRPEPCDLARSPRWFPLVGLLLGGLLAGLDALLSPLLAGPARDALVILALVALSGALHLDGLMDTCDGVLAPVSPARRLEIMRDSHVGSFGVAGAGLVLLGKYAALASLGETPRAAALIALTVLGRWGMTLAIGAFPAGRAEGLGRLVKDGTRPGDVLVAGLSALLVCGGLLQAAGLLLFVSVSLFVWLLARSLLTRLPGLTGDTYGALDELTELAALVLAPLCLRLAAALGPGSL